MIPLLILLAAGPGRPFADERVLLDNRLESLRRILPDGAQPQADVQHVEALAQAVGLGDLQVTARAPLETGPLGTTAVEVTGEGTYSDVDRFFRQVSLSWRLLDVDALRLDALPAGLVRFHTVLVLPFRSARAPVPAIPMGLLPPSDAPRGAGAAYVRDATLALSKSETIASWRRTTRNPRLFLAELSAITRDRAVVVSQASVGEAFSIKGFALGAGTMDAFERRAERGFFRVSEVSMVRRGGCHQFEIKGTVPTVGPDAELALPGDTPFGDEESACRVDRDPVTTRLQVKGPPRVVKGNPPSPDGPLTVRARGIDMADVFQILSRLTGADYVVDASVVGRVDVELVRMEEAEVMDAVATGLALGLGAPPVRLVSRAQGVRESSPDESSVPAEFALKRARVRDVLGAMVTVDPATAALAGDDLGRVSVFAADVPLGVLRQGVLAAAGLTEARDDRGRVIEGRDGGRLLPLVPPGLPVLAIRSDEVTADEFDLVAIAGNGDQWTAFAYSPTGTLNAYGAGDRLANGTVASVSQGDVLIQTNDGGVRIFLPLVH